MREKGGRQQNRNDDQAGEGSVRRNERDEEMKSLSRQ